MNAPRWILAIGAALALSVDASAQNYRSSIPTGMVTQQQQPEALDANLVSSVSFIDRAIPTSMVRLRYEYDSDNRRPTRGDYLYNKNGLPLPESSITAQDVHTYAEFALNPWFSIFVDQAAARWINPDNNANTYGVGDLDFGFKFAFCDMQEFMATFQLRATAPMHQREILGIDWAIEPALLVNYRPLENITLEGELRYWTSLSNNQFAGDLVRYGVGLTYGQHSPGEITLTPVLEVVGWTMLSGRSEVVHPGGVAEVADVAGSTIVNASGGVRLYLGSNMDLYAGYSRAVTGPAWYRDMLRVEFRLMY